MSQNKQKLCPIPATKFYSDYDIVSKKIDEIEQRHRNLQWTSFGLHPIPQRLFGPPETWEIYYKLADALEFAENESSLTTTLTTFVLQKTDGKREFIVAHPEYFWIQFNELLPEARCAYEVIPEDAACLIYLDLEYQKNLNQNSNGPRMTKTIIDIICAYMKYNWGIICNENNALNLDSTTNEKFSRHIIFRIKSIAFINNIHVGRFIKNICAEITEYLAINGCAFHNILSYFKRKDLEELIIKTGKGQKIFVDTCVYTRNRNFRIYRATKWGKFSHLTLAPENTYIPLNEMKNKELGIFLESLVSYFSDEQNKLVYLQVNEDLNDVNQYTQTSQRNRSQRNFNNNIKESPYPAIDRFILDQVRPGTIRAVKYFEQTQKIAYEIAGFRYCANIGREHKSNGIYWVVDLKRKCAYQKCHDQDDCGNFKSKEKPFPCELSFLLETADDNLFFDIPDTLDKSIESNNSNKSIKSF